MERSKSLHGAAPLPEPPPRPSRNSMIPESALADLSLGGKEPGLGAPQSRSASLLPNTKLMPETLPSARRGFLQRSTAIEEAGAPSRPPPRPAGASQDESFSRRGSTVQSSSTSSTAPLPTPPPRLSMVPPQDNGESFSRRGSAVDGMAPTPPPPRLSMLPQEDEDKGYVEANLAVFARGFSSRSGSTTSVASPSLQLPTASTIVPPRTSSVSSTGPGSAAAPVPARSPPAPRAVPNKISEDEDHAYEYQETLTQTATSAGGAKGPNKSLKKQITFDIEDTSCLGEPWYHGELNRVDAEDRLRKNGAEDGLFLVRNSSHGSASLAISVCHTGKILHHRLEMTPDRQYMFVGNSRRFRSLALLIDFYVKTPDEEKYRLKRYLNARLLK
eukprot:m.9672 g.9672  ORF g.9672 m.9672 type:complete len:387 (-) comp5455_c0_seq1:88-1248(-)